MVKGRCTPGWSGFAHVDYTEGYEVARLEPEINCHELITILITLQICPMDKEICEMKGAANIIGFIDAEISKLENKSNINGKDIMMAREKITMHEKSIHSHFLSIRKSMKRSYRDDDILRDQLTLASPIPIDTMIFEHLHTIGLGDVAEKMSAKALSDVSEKDLNYHPEVSTEITRQLNITKKWLDQSDEQIAKTLLSSEYSKTTHQLNDYFMLSLSRKFYLILTRDENDAIEYLNQIYTSIKQVKATKQNYTLESFDKLVSELCKNTVYIDRQSSWIIIERIERQLDDLIVKSSSPVTTTQMKLLGESTLAKVTAHGAFATALHSPKLKYITLVHDAPLPIDFSTTEQKPYHTVFVCPVTKEEASPETGIFLLPCKHLISAAAIKMMRGSSSGLVCPYCKLHYSENNIVSVELI